MKVICICYDGSEISEDTVNSIVTIVSPFVKNKSKAIVNRYGDKDIADVFSALSLKTVSCETVKSSVDAAVEKAACYIRKRFGLFFSNKVRLALSMVEVKNSYTEESKIFKNASSIILENRFSTVLADNGITTEVVEVIENVNM